MIKPTLMMGGVALLVGFALADLRADDTFREFPDPEVLRPVELFRTLLEMQNLPPELLEQARRMSANMSPSKPPPDLGLHFDQGAGSNVPRTNVPGIQGPPGKTSPAGKKMGSPAPSSQRGPNGQASPQGPSGSPLPGSPPPGGSPQSPFGPGSPSGNRSPSKKQANASPRNGPGTSKSKQRSADRARSTANENFRQRMNRILLNAAREAAQRESEGAPRNALERLLEKAQKEVAEAVNKSSPETRRKWRKRFQQVGKNSQGQRSADWLNSSHDGAGATPSLGARSGTLWPWLVLASVAAMAVGAGIFYRRSKRRSAAIAARQRARHEKRVKTLIHGIRTHRELIDALDQLVLWRHGEEASSWDSTRVGAMLRRGSPRSAPQIEDLIHHYTLAKYSPAQKPLNVDQLTRAAATLDVLADDAQSTDWGPAARGEALPMSTIPLEPSERDD